MRAMRVTYTHNEKQHLSQFNDLNNKCQKTYSKLKLVSMLTFLKYYL